MMKDSKQQPSKVLLVCIYDTITCELTNQIIFETFIPKGKVQRVLIFQRGEMTKCFVELSSIEEAIQVRQVLDGTRLYGSFCKMHIYFSNLERIDLKNQFSKGRDFSSTTNTVYSESTPATDNFEDFDPFSQFRMAKDGQGEFKKSKTTDPTELLKAISRLEVQTGQIGQDYQCFPESQKQTPPIFQGIWRERVQSTSSNSNRRRNQSAPYAYSSKMDIEMSDYEPSMGLQQYRQNSQRSELQKQFPPQPKVQQQQEQYYPYSPDNKNTVDSKYQPVPAFFGRSDTLSFPYTEELKVFEVYNLFSNYGNIERIVKRPGTMYVVFANIEFCVLAKEYLQGVILFDNLLNLSFCNRRELRQRPREYMESIMYDSSFFRFNSRKSISINPPSNTLHISNLKREVCTEQKLRQIFRDCGKLQKIQILSQSKEKNMALVKFEKLEDSIRVVASMHNREFSGRKMQISFTKSKI